MAEGNEKHFLTEVVRHCAAIQGSLVLEKL